MVGSQDRSDDMTCSWEASSLACYERSRAAMDITENAYTNTIGFRTRKGEGTCDDGVPTERSVDKR